MSNINSHITANTKGLENPITFAGTNKQKVAQVTALMSLEATQPTEHRLYLDEMSPACRDSLLVVLAALEDSVVNA